MRGEEDISSPETAKLRKGQELRVLAHGVEKGGRRILVKEMETGDKGWVSCATKTGKALLELLPGAAIPVHELDVPMSTALVRMPTVEEVLARVAADAYLEDDGAREPKAILDGAEGEAEAICVWHAFTDMAAVDEPQEEDPHLSEACYIINREREREMAAGDLMPMVAVSEEQTRKTQDHQLQMLTRDREAKAARSQGMKDKLKQAIAPRTKGIMPKMRGIASRSTAAASSEASSSSGIAGPIAAPLPAGAPSRVSHFSTAMGPQAARFAPRPSSWPEAPSSNFSPQQQASLQSVQELRWTLEDERRQADEESAGGAPPAAAQPALSSSWAPRRVSARARDGAGASTAIVSAPAEAPPPPLAPAAEEPAPAAKEAPPGELSAGMVVRILGLKSAPELNGLHAICQHWDAEGSRWVVRLEGGKCKKFRPQNLAPCEDTPYEDPQASGGIDDFGPAWFGRPDPESAADPQASGGMDEFGPAWFGQPDPDSVVDLGPGPLKPQRCKAEDDEGIPGVDALLKQLDGAGPGPAAFPGKRGCDDYGKAEYWARIGLAPR